ncbi:uncharacterized protein LOC134822596 [Bolinopsis microptera]|uniref:uncharacterized protein LOC134822596 n=1 Tax=Bolinopsis microptera TaxID=2820187 RepID=UPI003079ACC2
MSITSGNAEGMTSQLTRPLNSLITLCLTRLSRQNETHGAAPSHISNHDIRVPVRNGQTSAGDHIKTLFDCDLPTDKENETFVKCLEKAQLQGPGIRFVVIGSENYVGKWLNGGRRGHGLNYKCFAQQFVGSPVGPGQRNFFEQTLLLGEVQYDDITKQLDDMAQAEGIEQTNIKYGDNKVYDRMVEEASIRCQRRLANIVRCIARCSLRPICISGGNEDILGLGYGVHLGRTIARGTPSNLTLGNFDCHGDYKNLEERGAHSGNGFSFLNTIGILKKYAVLGLSPYENRESMMEQLISTNCWYRYLDDISVIGAPNRPSLHESLLEMIKALDAENDEVPGLCVDLDVTEDLTTVSCPATLGITRAQVHELVQEFTRYNKPFFLLLAEGMPDPMIPLTEGINRTLGKYQAGLVSCFLRNCISVPHI